MLQKCELLKNRERWLLLCAVEMIFAAALAVKAVTLEGVTHSYSQEAFEVSIHRG